MTTLLEQIVRMMLDGHPTPWAIEYDWCVEVYDANGGLVIKMMKDAEARELIGLAERLQVQSNDAAREIERMLTDESTV